MKFWRWNGKKSYLHIDDCLDGILLVGLAKRPAKNLDLKFEVFNLGLDETIVVAESAQYIAECMGLSPEYKFQKQKRGWVGDNPFVHLSIKKMNNLG